MRCTPSVAHKALRAEHCAPLGLSAFRFALACPALPCSALCADVPWLALVGSRFSTVSHPPPDGRLASALPEGRRGLLSRNLSSWLVECRRYSLGEMPAWDEMQKLMR